MGARKVSFGAGNPQEEDEMDTGKLIKATKKKFSVFFSLGFDGAFFLFISLVFIFVLSAACRDGTYASTWVALKF